MGSEGIQIPKLNHVGASGQIACHSFTQELKTIDPLHRPLPM